METKLDEGFLLVHVQFPEDLGGVQEMGVIHNFLDVECNEWQIEYKRNPVPVDKEEDGQEAMDGSFWYDVCVEAIAEIDGINVVTLQIAVHDRKEYL